MSEALSAMIYVAAWVWAAGMKGYALSVDKTG
jgi:hypothetical protein